MTRDEFMQHAQNEIDDAFSRMRNRMLNLIEQAWAEGKRNAELKSISEIGARLAEIAKESLLQTPACNSVTISADYVNKTIANIPDACKNCQNHPSNGGSGICNCIIGTPQTKC